MMRIVRFPIIVVRKDGEVLLAYNKRGFSRNKWTVFGGSLLKKETLSDAAVRNLKEQCGLSTSKLEKCGKIEIKFGGVQELIQIHIFITDMFSGEPKDSKDFKPQWFKIKDIPCKEMWADVPYWLEPILNGKRVKGFFIYQNEELIYEEMDVKDLST